MPLGRSALTVIPADLIFQAFRSRRLLTTVIPKSSSLLHYGKPPPLVLIGEEYIKLIEEFAIVTRDLEIPRHSQPASPALPVDATHAEVFDFEEFLDPVF